MKEEIRKTAVKLAMDTLKFDKGARVKSRDGKVEGFVTGSNHLCQMTGCSGRRISVRWPDGKNTFPCSKGMKWEGRHWRIMG